MQQFPLPSESRGRTVGSGGKETPIGGGVTHWRWLNLQILKLCSNIGAREISTLLPVSLGGYFGLVSDSSARGTRCPQRGPQHTQTS